MKRKVAVLFALALLFSIVGVGIGLRSAPKIQSVPMPFLSKAGLWVDNPDKTLTLHDYYSLENEEAVIRILTIGARLGMPNGTMMFGPSGKERLPVGFFVQKEWEETVSAGILYSITQEEGFPVQICYNKDQQDKAVSFIRALGSSSSVEVSVVQCGSPTEGRILIEFPDDSPFTGERPEEPIPVPDIIFNRWA